MIRRAVLLNCIGCWFAKIHAALVHLASDKCCNHSAEQTSFTIWETAVKGTAAQLAANPLAEYITGGRNSALPYWRLNLAPTCCSTKDWG